MHGSRQVLFRPLRCPILPVSISHVTTTRAPWGADCISSFRGVAEAGLFPGVNYYLSCWYKRSEFGIRAAIFFSAAAIAGSFGGLLAAAINKMKGVGGLNGWSWIFILEGLATVLIGCASWWMVHDFPDEATFLTDEDRRRVHARLRLDMQSSAEHEEYNFKYFISALKDWKMYMFMIIYQGCDTALYAFSLFLPTIIKGLGYTNTRANLLTVPPYAVAACFTIFIGWIADRSHQRAYCNLACGVLAVAGFIMLIASTNPHVQYAGTFLGAMGIYPCIPNTISWVSNNIEGVYKRGIVMGFVIGWGNLNGVVSSNIYRAPKNPKVYPRYFLGHGYVLAAMALLLFGGTLATRILLARENKQRLAGKRDYLVEGKSEEQLRDLGDRRPDFLYHM